MRPPPHDGDGLERRSLTGTARRRRANTNSLTQGVARSHLPRHLARGRYVVAALRAACRSETGAPSLRAIRSRGAPPPSSIFMPDGVRGRTRAWVFLPVGASRPARAALRAAHGATPPSPDGAGGCSYAVRACRSDSFARLRRAAPVWRPPPGELAGAPSRPRHRAGAAFTQQLAGGRHSKPYPPSGGTALSARRGHVTLTTGR